jgi:hypothetical protein
MATETQTTTAHCPTHGTIQATREIPRVTFPPIITTVRRALAKRRPFQCPACGADVKTN